MQYKVDPEIFKSDLNGADARHVAHEPVDYQLYWPPYDAYKVYWPPDDGNMGK